MHWNNSLLLTPPLFPPPSPFPPLSPPPSRGKTMLLLHQRCGHQLRRLHRMSATRSAPSPIVHRIVGETPGPSNLAGTDRLTCDGSEYAVAAHGTGDGYPTFRVDMVDVHAGPVWDLLATRSVTSTQRLVEQNAASLPQRCVVVADTQSKGKGRSGNVWVSPEGCLMFSSIHCLNLEGSKLPFAQYATTLAAVKSIDRLCNFEPGHFARIKWPNDVYIDDQKVGGVICQTTYRDKSFRMVVGVGINVDNASPTFCINAALRNRSRRTISREKLLSHIVPDLIQAYDTLCTENGFSSMEDAYYRYWLHADQEVLVKTDAMGSQAKLQSMKARIVGLSSNGFLLAQDGDGAAIELHPDGNR